MKEFLKSVKNWQSYCHEFGVLYVWHSLDICLGFSKFRSESYLWYVYFRDHKSYHCGKNRLKKMQELVFPGDEQNYVQILIFVNQVLEEHGCVLYSILKWHLLVVSQETGFDSTGSSYLSIVYYLSVLPHCIYLLAGDKCVFCLLTVVRCQVSLNIHRLTLYAQHLWQYMINCLSGRSV